MRIAMTRKISDEIVNCELTHIEREPIDLPRARWQHASYEEELGLMGCTVVSLPADPNQADCVFIEDTALVFDELAIIMRPGVKSRRGEVHDVQRALGKYRKRIEQIEPPGHLDGGDVYFTGKNVFVGVGHRTNDEGFDQLAALMEPLGYTMHRVSFDGALHLTTASSVVNDSTILCNAQWVNPDQFPGFTVVTTEPGEDFGGNGVRVGDKFLYPRAFPKTAKKLEQAGIELHRVDMDELGKAEGSLTCCSLVFNDIED